MNQKSPLFEIFLYFILIVKILFVFFLLLTKYESIKGNKSKEKKYKYYEETLHKLFTFCMGILLILLFSGLTKGQVCIDGHTKIFLFAFGVLSIISLIQDFIHTTYHSLPDKLKNKK